jgi:16S rRNA (uracil1498-N3)-methyltransferase
VEFLRKKGVKIISLGRRILRAETAAIVAGGVILNEIW